MTYEKECLHCGKPFTTDNKIKVTCSNECRVERNRQNANARVLDHCVVCGKPYEKARYSVKTTCGEECRKVLWDNTRTDKKKKKDGVVAIEKAARKKGLRYADIQKQQTLAMVGGVKV